jgi:hypothetical protein
MSPVRKKVSANNCDSLMTSTVVNTKLFLYLGHDYEIKIIIIILPAPNPQWVRVVGYGPFSLCVIHKEGLCPSDGGINIDNADDDIILNKFSSTYSTFNQRKTKVKKKATKKY